MADKEADSSKLDISLLRTPIQISGSPIEQVLNSIHYGSPELRCLLMDECDLIFECKVCRALFRDLPNFISHKRAYCTKSALETRHVTIASLPEEKVVVIQPQAPEDTSSGLSSAPQHPRSVRPNLEQTIMRIQSGELGKSEAYKVYTEAADKLQRQKEGMKVATIRTTAIPTNKNAVFIDVNMASVNIHERQQQVNNGIMTGYEQKRNDNSVTVIKRKPGERHSNTRNVRKSAKQERPSSEPQKLLMEQLKEIQHKVKQKVAAAHDKTAPQKKVRSVPQIISSQKDTVGPTTDSFQKTPVNTNTTRAQKKLADSSGLKVLSSDNVQSAAASDEETKGNCKDESDPEEVKYALVKPKGDNKIRSKAAKENKLLTAIAVTAATRRKKLSKRVPVCSKCNSVFATNKSLHYHEQIHHSGKRTFYPCPYCSSVFYYFFGITRHLFRNHSKSLEEIDAMRRQLREMSFTKPLSASLCMKEGQESIPGSVRSTRSLGRSHLLNLFPGTPSLAESSVSSDKQLSKKTSADGGDISEVTLKFTRHKIPQENNTHKEHLTSSKFSGLKTEDVVSAKEDKGEARPIRIKNRQQLRPGDNTKNPGNNLIGSPVRVSTPVSSSPIISRSQDNTSHLCPKCHRAFRRKISCKNHIKLCKAKGSSTKKPERTPNTRHKSQLLTQESVNFFNSNKHAKMKNKIKTNNQDTTEKVTVTADNQSKSPMKIPENKDENVKVVQDESSERKPSSRNSQVSSVDTLTSLVQRSSSVDRLLTSDQPRNRSRERNSAARDERDSSVESTQSNMEGKSPRSRRNVLSRYATLAQLSKSPSKMDTSVKSDLSNESCDKFSDSQSVDIGENSSETRDKFLHNGRDKTSREDIEVDNLNSEITHTETSDGRDGGMPESSVKTRPSTVRNTVKNISDPAQDVAHPAENDIKIGEEINHAASLSETSLLSLVASNRSPEKQQDPQLSSRYSPHKSSPKGISPSADKLPGSVDRSDPFPRMSLESCKVEVKEDTCDVSTSAVTYEVIDIVEDKLETDLDNASVKSEEPTLNVVDSNSKQDIQDLVTNAGETLEITASDHKSTENNQSVQQDVLLDVAGSDRKSTENDLNVGQKLQLGNPEYKQESSESLMEKEPTVQDQVEEELPTNVQTEFDSETINLIVEEDQALDMKKPDVTSKEQTVSENNKNSGSSGNLKTTSGNSKNKDNKTHNLPPVAVISALSERPKRKRKVPSRNKDAEEMLSKIHNHNRDVPPAKKAKIIHEIKASESLKKKLKTENIKTETFTVPEVDKTVKHAKDESGTHAKNRRLLQKDESLELEYVDDDSDEMFGKAKGRFVSNRMYVLEKFGSKSKRLKCYDQTKVYRMIDEEQLKCLECGESFSQVCNLRRHVMRQHLKWSRFKCKLCKFESYDRSECATHLIRGHKNRAITLRNVNQFILDLVKQGSHARSLKKNETIKVKQKSESQEGNIYARPTVKKTHRLPQKADDETSPRSTSKENTASREMKSANELPQVWTIEQLEPLPQVWTIEQLEPTSNSSESITSIVTASKKLTNSSTSPSKVEAQFKQTAQQNISSKAGLEAAGKGTRKALPFNISTRNSPRTFDTRPYNSANDGASAETSNSKQKMQPITGKVNIHEEVVFPSQKLEIETGISRNKIQPISGKGNIEKSIVLPSGKSSQKSDARSNGSIDTDVLKSTSGIVNPALVESSSTDSAQTSRNIFEHIKLQTTSSASAVNSVVTTTATVSEPALCSRQELSVTSNLLHQIPSPKIIEVKVESPKSMVSVSSSQILSQKLPSHKKAASVKSEKSKVVNYAFRGPQLSTVNSDQVGKSLIKLEFGDQVSLPGASVSPSQPVAKLNLPPGKFTSAQVIDCTNLQRKHMSISSSSGAAKIIPMDTLKVAQRSAGTSKDTVGSSSGLSLAAALTKGGHIFTTVATSFLVSHGQAGKFIVYTRPAGAKDSTTVSSVTKQSPVPSTSSLTSSATATGAKTLDANPQKDSQSQGAVGEDVLSPGTFVIRKHYL